MPLTLRELLADPSLGLGLVAGADGLDARGGIRWAHISETPDPTPWLEGGELLLTTGLGVRDDEVLQRGLVARLDERGCVGVGFGVGVSVPDVPAAMLGEADARDLPLFTVPYEVPFIAVTRRVSQAVFDEHYATLRAAVDLHRDVLASVVGGHGSEGVLRTVARHAPDFAAILFGYYGQPIASVNAADLDPARFWSELGPLLRARDRVTVHVAGRTVVAAVVRIGPEAEAVLALVGDRPLGEYEALLLEQGLAGVTLELARGRSVREARQARVDDLLADVSESRISQRALARELRRLGLDPDRPVTAVCVRGSPGRDRRLVGTVVEDALAGAGLAPVVGAYDGAVYALVEGDPGVLDSVVRAARLRGWDSTRIGRSRVVTGTGSLDRALREAAAAADASRDGEVTDIGSLGLGGLLASVGDGSGARAFVEEMLGPVVRYDDEHGAGLVVTLRTYLRHACRPGPAAQELQIHRHTLSYRLHRVEELTGRDLRDGRDILELGLALELRDRIDR